MWLIYGIYIALRMILLWSSMILTSWFLIPSNFPTSVVYTLRLPANTSGSTSLVIKKNKKKRNVDIRRPQTTRRMRVSSPTLNYKPKRPLNYKHKQDICGVFLY
eukprot:946052_1